MDISGLKRGERAVVLKVELPVLVKERLRAVGIFTGERITVLKVLSRKKIVLLQTGRSGAKVAIDSETAAGVTVWRT